MYFTGRTLERFFIEAEGSPAGTGAGGFGAASPAAAAAPPSPPQPQPESQPPQPQLLQLWQQPHLLLKIASSKPLRQHFFLQQELHESQAGASQHFGASQAGASQPQPLLQVLQLSQQQLRLRSSKPRRPPNRSQQLLHELQLLQVLQELHASHASHFGSQQAGLQHFGSQQVGLQHLGAQHFGAQQGSQQPQPSPPSMRSRSSKLNPWLHKPRLTTIAPIIMCNFIEPRLLMR